MLATIAFSLPQIGALTAQSGTAMAAEQASGNRIAIVIGNQDCDTVGDLTNARKDAEDIADMLRGFNFRV